MENVEILDVVKIIVSSRINELFTNIVEDGDFQIYTGLIEIIMKHVHTHNFHRPTHFIDCVFTTIENSLERSVSKHSSEKYKSPIYSLDHLRSIMLPFDHRYASLKLDGLFGYFFLLDIGLDLDVVVEIDHGGSRRFRNRWSRRWHIINLYLHLTFFRLFFLDGIY